MFLWLSFLLLVVSARHLRLIIEPVDCIDSMCFVWLDGFDFLGRPSVLMCSLFSDSERIRRIAEFHHRYVAFSLLLPRILAFHAPHFRVPP